MGRKRGKVEEDEEGSKEWIEGRTEGLRGLMVEREVEGSGRGRKGRWNSNIDVIRFPDETPLFFPRLDSELSKYNLGYIIIIIGTTDCNTVYEKQSSFALQNLHYYNYLTRQAGQI